jgi:two-component system sensor histidine kinase QseC
VKDARGTGGSLRRRVTIGAVCAMVMVWLGATFWAWLDTRHEIDELLDGYLAQSAALLLAQVGDDPEEIDVEHAPQLHRYARHLAFQVWEHGRLRVHSTNAPGKPLASGRDGLHDATIDGRRWRVFVASEPRHGIVVQVGEARRERDALSAGIVRSLLLPLGFALPLLALALWLAVALGLRPLRLLGSEVERRDPRNLGPLEASTSPDEVAPLVASLNRLFARVRESIEHEKRFTADAAHELRTPIAALRAQAQVAQGAVDSVERDRALAQVVASCDRAARLVEQLLTLARLEPAADDRAPQRCDLAHIARTVVAEAAPAAVAKSIEVGLDAPGSAPIDASRELVAVLVRNLVDNAVRYSPAGTGVRVVVASEPDAVELRVADDGPGVPRETLARLGERFFRQPGTGESGSGLGLSIVRRIADLHDARLAFDANSQGRGLAVTVRFHPAASQAAKSSTAK